MSEPARTEESCGEYKTGAPYPLKQWWQFSQIFYPDVGLPPVLEPGDAPWFKGRRAACSWLGLVPPLFVPYISEPMHRPDQKTRKWRVIMDLAHFCPPEISLRVGGGFLEVRGSHRERPDEHGFITRCFSRKYRLPAEVDVSKLVSTLSSDGILTIEAPVPETSASAAVIIPIKVESEGEEQEVKTEDEEEEAESEVHHDQDQPSSTTAETEQKDEETHPSVPPEDKNSESLQKSSELHKAPESAEDPGTSTQLEPEEPGLDDGEIQVKEEGGEEQQELGSGPPPEVQSQELEAADMKQEAAE